MSVAVGEEFLAQDAAEKGENALREFGGQEEDQDGQQHPCSPVVFLRRLVRSATASFHCRFGVWSAIFDGPLFGAGQDFVLGRRAVAFEVLAPLLGADKGADKPETEDGQSHARDQFDNDAVRPEIDVLQQAGVGFGQLASAQEVDGVLGWLAQQAGRIDGQRILPHFLLNCVRQVERDADERWADVSEQDGQKCSVERAPVARPERMRNGQVSPDGQQERQPNGDGVEHLGDVSVNEDVDGPWVAEPLVDGPLAQDVHVEGERDVFDHDQVIG